MRNGVMCTLHTPQRVLQGEQTRNPVAWSTPDMQTTQTYVLQQQPSAGQSTRSSRLNVPGIMDDWCLVAVNVIRLKHSHTCMLQVETEHCRMHTPGIQKFP